MDNQEKDKTPTEQDSISKRIKLISSIDNRKSMLQTKITLGDGLTKLVLAIAFLGFWVFAILKYFY